MNLLPDCMADWTAPVASSPPKLRYLEGQERRKLEPAPSAISTFLFHGLLYFQRRCNSGSSFLPKKTSFTSSSVTITATSAWPPSASPCTGYACCSRFMPAARRFSIGVKVIVHLFWNASDFRNRIPLLGAEQNIGRGFTLKVLIALWRSL